MPFDAIDVGDELPPLRLTLSAAEMKRYAEAANMRVGASWATRKRAPRACRARS